MGWTLEVAWAPLQHSNLPATPFSLCFLCISDLASLFPSQSLVPHIQPSLVPSPLTSNLANPLPLPLPRHTPLCVLDSLPSDSSLL